MAAANVFYMLVTITSSVPPVTAMATDSDSALVLTSDLIVASIWQVIDKTISYFGMQNSCTWPTQLSSDFSTPSNASNYTPEVP
jgi:hypothetical protein